MNQIHVLDVPELLALICSYLKLHDYAACARVCRHWNSVFTALVWRDVSITNTLQDAAILSAEGQQGFTRNLPYVQSIQIRFVQTLDALLPFLRPKINNLTRFVIPASFEYRVPLYPKDYEVSVHDYHLQTIVRRISEREDFGVEPIGTDYHQPLPPEQVPIPEEKLVTLMNSMIGLRELILMVFPFSQGSALRTIADSLPLLERLQLVNHQPLAPDFEALKYLVDNLAPNLSYLGLSIYCSATVGLNSPWMADDIPDASSASSTETMASIVDSFPASDVIEGSGLSSSSVGISDVKPNKLKEILIDGDMRGFECERPVRDRDCAMLLGSSRAWKEVSLLCVTGFGSLARETLLQHAATLESVSISMCLGFPEQFILTLLKYCPRLKTLNPFNFDNKESNSVQVNSFCNTEIACSDSLWFLRILPILPYENRQPPLPTPPIFFQIGPGTSASQQHEETPQLALPPQGQSLDIQQNQVQEANPHHFFQAVVHQMQNFQNGQLAQPLRSNAATLQRQVYQRLATLTELEELWVGEPDFEQISVNHLLMIKRLQPTNVSITLENASNLEFSLNSGLEIMAGMKKLRVLGVRGLRHCIGIPELRWMVHEWPKLERIDGLLLSYNEETPEMEQWLKSNAPFLQYT
ncbi:hypothetical protein BGZ79_009152 [Entomortierella chlamydospora]|nr:hypothetical protein BGZ79_009152 [Entomortierella chlamydospora]